MWWKKKNWKTKREAIISFWYANTFLQLFCFSDNQHTNLLRFSSWEILSCDSSLHPPSKNLKRHLCLYFCFANKRQRHGEQMYRGQSGEELGDWDWHIYAIDTMYEIDDWYKPVIWLRELYSVLSGDLNGKEIQKRGGICTPIADSLCCIVETNTSFKAIILQ